MARERGPMSDGPKGPEINQFAQRAEPSRAVGAPTLPRAHGIPILRREGRPILGGWRGKIAVGVAAILATGGGGWYLNNRGGGVVEPSPSPFPTATPRPSESAPPTPNTTSEPTATPEPPKDALQATIMSFLEKDANGQYTRHIPPQERFQGPNAGGTALADMRFNIPYDAVQSDIPDSMRGKVDIYAYVLGSETLPSSTDPSKNFRVMYLLQEDTARERFFIPVSLGEVRDDQYFFLNRLNKKTYQDGEKIVLDKDYTTAEFERMSEEFDNTSTFVYLDFMEADLSNFPDEPSHSRWESWNEGIKLSKSFALEYFTWDKTIADWATIKRQGIPPNLNINQRLTSVAETKTLYIRGLNY